MQGYKKCLLCLTGWQQTTGDVRTDTGRPYDLMPMAGGSRKRGNFGYTRTTTSILTTHSSNHHPQQSFLTPTAKHHTYQKMKRWFQLRKVKPALAQADKVHYLMTGKLQSDIAPSSLYKLLFFRVIL